MRDLPEGTPPLAPALAALGRVSVAAALAVGGVPLCGGGGGGNGSSFAAAPPSGAAWLGWDPSPSLSPLLQVSVVVDVSAPDAVAAAARRHAASGLDRAELQELFVEGGGNGAATIVKGREDGRGEVAAAAAGAGVVVDAACCGASSSSSASSSPPSPSWGGRRRQDDDGDGKDGFHQHKDDPLAFLDRLPLYGRPEAATAALSPSPPSGPSADGEDAAAIVAAGREGRLVVGGGPVGQLNPLSTARARAEAELALRAFRLALAFLPFVLLGLPLLAAAATLMERARERERQALGIGDDDEDQDQSDDGGNDNDDDESFWSDPARQQRAAAAWRRRQQERERRAAERRAAQRQQQELEQQLMLHSEGQAAVARLLRAQLAALRVAMAAVAALLELLLLLALGGDWMASASSSSPGSGAGTRSGGPFEAAALRLRRAAWSLLLSGCARSGAAVIKCGQWAAVRRDLFAGDLCDALSRLHDDAPSHAPEETRRALERAFGGGPGGGPGGAAASSSSWTRRALERAFGGGPGGAAASSSSWTRVFESFEWQPVASGSIAQVHRAVLRTRSRGGGGDDDDDEGDSDDADDAEGQQPGGLVVAVKVRHPGVARHIAMDFLLLRRLASLAERALRWLAGRGRGSGNGDGPRAPPLVHTLGQFSRTMAAQADLRVEAVHMLRFARDFDAQGGQARLMLSAAAPSAATAATTTTTPPIAVPLPVAGMAAAEVLVETFEPGASVGRHLAAAVAERAMLERRARERRLERRRRERECAERQEQREREHGERQEPTPPSLPDQPQQHQQQQQAAAGPVAACRGKLVGAVRAVASRAAGLGRGARRRARRMCEARGGSPNSSSSRSQIVALFLEAWLHMLLDTGFMHQDLHPGNLLVRARAEGSEGGGGSGSSGSSSSIAGGPAEQQQQQQLVLLDFGLAEELSPDVRRHFVSFLNHVAAGSPAHATRHLLCWSSSGQGEDQRQHRASSSSSSRARRALLADMAELFNSGCDLSSENGIDLDAVLGRVLLLVKKHGVALDGSHALLCMGCCALVRCASALDPEFNLLDAAAPALLCHALTGSRALLGGGGTTAGLLV
jgi:predicted unusual protein kinase regulating ubiquinone biosynthesis (AarF/ABC1/UbiB family)